jgi:hypothetical protein
VDFKQLEAEEPTSSDSPGLYKTFKQVEEGYSIVLFGYGLSGSGKTFTLIGNKDVPGIIHYGLANLKGVSEGTTTIAVKYIFEQYYSSFTPTNKNITGKIHTLVGNPFQSTSTIKRLTSGGAPIKSGSKLVQNPQLTDIIKMITDEKGDQFFGAKIKPENINLENIKIDEINKLTAVLEQYRIEKKRIKETPNNPVSSRSHLYIVFEIKFEDGKKGYVTIVDTAGRESPTDIFKLYIDTTKYPAVKLQDVLPPGNREGGIINIQKYMYDTLKEKYTKKYTNQRRPEIENDIILAKQELNNLKQQQKQGATQQIKNSFKTIITQATTKLAKTEKLLSTLDASPLREDAENIYDILNEGVYINETINHLMYYFDKKNNINKTITFQTGDLKDYSESKYYVDPRNEERNELSDINNCLMIPILNKLDQLNKSSNSTNQPTKFITMVCVRQDIPPKEEQKEDKKETKIDTCAQTVKSLEFAVSIKSS